MKCKICGAKEKLFRWLIWGEKCYHCGIAEMNVKIKKRALEIKRAETREDGMVKRREKYFQ